MMAALKRSSFYVVLVAIVLHMANAEQHHVSWGLNSTSLSIYIQTGDSVAWHFDQEPEMGLLHSVTSGNLSDWKTLGKIFDSGYLMSSPETVFWYTFEEAGEYPFFCLPHPDMQGVVYVSDPTTTSVATTTTTEKKANCKGRDKKESSCKKYCKRSFADSYQLVERDNACGTKCKCECLSVDKAECTKDLCREQYSDRMERNNLWVAKAKWYKKRRGCKNVCRCVLKKRKKKNNKNGNEN